MTPTHWAREYGPLWLNYSSNDGGTFGVTIGWRRITFWLGRLLIGVHV